MYRIAMLLAFMLVLGCAPAEETPVAETTSEEPDPIQEASFDGEWDVEALGADGDSVLVRFGMTASDGAEGWGLVFDHLDEPVAAADVAVSGDSATVTFEPYSSALRDDVMVTTTTMLHVVGDEITGRFSATYANGDVVEGGIRASR